MEHKNHAPVSFGIVFLVIIATAILLVKIDDNRKPINIKENTNNNGNLVASNPIYKCGLTISSPLSNSPVSFPLSLSGAVNNQASTDGCTWVLFEGQGGVVSVSDGVTTYATAPVSMVGDWMTNGPVNFNAILSPSVTIPSGTPLTITFSEENPSGEGVNDSISFQVISQ